MICKKWSNKQRNRERARLNAVLSMKKAHITVCVPLVHQISQGPQPSAGSTATAIKCYLWLFQSWLCMCVCVCVTAALEACVHSYLKSMEHSRLRLNAKVGIREESRTLNPRNQLSMWPLTSIFRDTAMAQCWQVNSVWVMEVSPDKLGLHLMPFRVTHVMFCAVSHWPRFFDRLNILWQTASCTTTLYVLGALKTNWCVSILEMGFMALENLEKPFLSKSYSKTGSLLYLFIF